MNLRLAFSYMPPRSEGEVVTQLQIQGSYQGTIDYGLGEVTVPYTSVTDYHLLRSTAGACRR